MCAQSIIVILFVALETVALAFYPLVAYNRGSTKSLEAGIKYLLFGALSSALLLLGIVLIYGVGANPMAWGAVSPGPIGMDFLFDYVALLLEENQSSITTNRSCVGSFRDCI